MSSTIEERIVSMKFDGNAFLTGVDKSLQKLDQLNNKLKAQDGVKGLDNIGAAAGRQSSALSKIADGVSHISDRFKTMGVVGMAALNSITNQAVFAGEQMIKSLSFGPVLDGFHEYETNMTSIQTILSNTQAAGTKLSDVTAALDDLNHYSDQTIYNFSEMAKNIGTFTAAGVALKPATQAIKGIANLAALSGSNSEQASGAMYQLSQAISSGKVSLEDWNSVVNAGMGGTVFQRALAQNAEKMGTLKDNAVSLIGPMKNVQINGKSFRDSITAKPGQTSWLTSGVLTQTLAQFTGDLSDAALKAQGFNKAEIAAIQSQAKMAKNAATQVKTLSQLLGTIKESIGSGWATTWKTIFGDFPEAKALFTNVNNVLSGYVSASANARNKVLSDWKAMGGRTAIINAIANSFKALIAFVKPIKDAFREIFPATTGAQLANISKSIEGFTKNLTISGTTANNLKRTFAGFFAVIDIGWTILKRVVTLFFNLFSVATEGSGSILDFTGNMGDFLVSLDKSIKSGTGLYKVFNTLFNVLSKPIKVIRALAGYLGDLFEGFSSSQAAKNVAAFAAKLNPLGKVGAIIATVWGHAEVIFQNIWKTVQKLGPGFEKVFGGLGDRITSALTGLNFADFLKTVDTGLFGALVILIKKFFDKIKGEEGEGFLDKFKEGIEGLTGALNGMQHALQAAAILQIAAAIGILAISMAILSKIDAAGLARASAAIGAMFVQLMGSMIAFQKISGFAGFAKMPFVAAALILLASAVLILSSAVTKLADLSWEELAKGLTGTTVLLASLIAVVKFMPKGPRLITTAAGLVILAAAIKVLASAVGDLSGLSWTELAKGLVGVGATLAALTLFTKFSAADKGGISQGVGIVLLATGIKILASAIQDMAQMSWGEIAKGLVTLGGALYLIGDALIAIPPSSYLSAASVLIVAASLNLIGDALAKMAEMSWGEIAKSMVVLAGSLTIIAVAMDGMIEALPGAAALLVVAGALVILAQVFGEMAGMSWGDIGKSMVVLAGSLFIIAAAIGGMEEALPGAAALIVVAAALAILTPVLVTLGSMSLTEILTGLLAMAGAFLVIGIAAEALSEAIPFIIGLGAGVALVGAAVALAGAGVFLFAAGLTLLAASGVAAAAAIVGMVNILLGALPQIVKLVGALLVALLDLVIQTAPKMGQAVTVLIGTLITVISNLTPRIVNMMLSLAQKLINALQKYLPTMVSTGSRLLSSFLNGLASKIGNVVAAGTNLVVAFINGVSKNLSRVIDAGVKLVISFVNGVANSIRNNSAAMRAAGRNLGSAIIEGMTGGIRDGVGAVINAAKNIASSAINAAKSVLDINSPSKEFIKIGKSVNEGFAKGLDGDRKDVDAAFKSLRDDVKTAMTESGNDVVTLTAKLKKLKSARHEDSDAIKETTKALKQAKKEHAAESATYTLITKQMNAQHSALDKLADKYDVVTAKLKTANDAYANAVKTRDDYKKSITDQYSDAVAPTGDTTAADYVTNLKKQVEDTKSFANQLQQARKLGLNNETYMDLLGQGTSALPFLTDLLKGGKAQIAQVNALNKQLDSLGASMGKTASSTLYQAAVDSAAGLVKGLANQQKAIEAQMDKIADAMVKAIKKKLGIKSPSRVFAEVGKFSAQGLSNGLDENADLVVKSAANTADKAVAALRSSLSNVNNMVLAGIDVEPAIKPVLDLTDIQKNASKIGAILPTNAKMTLDSAYSNAASVGAAVRARVAVEDGDGHSPSGAVVSYTQINNSPKALSAVEIYRGTKNQLSNVKGALST